MNGIDFRGLIQANVAARFPIGTLGKTTPGTYNSSDPAAGTSPTTTSYTVNVNVQKFKSSMVEGDLARQITATVNVYLGSLPTNVRPAAGDSLTFPDPSAPDASVTVTAKIQSADPSPNGASCLCEVLA